MGFVKSKNDLPRDYLRRVQRWSSSTFFFAKMGFVKFKNRLRWRTTMLWLNILFLKYYTLMALRFGFNHQSSISLCRGLKYWSKGHAKWSVCHLFGPWCGRRRPPWPTSASAKMDTAQKHTSKADPGIDPLTSPFGAFVLAQLYSSV